jgi:hypothetical protein
MNRRLTIVALSQGFRVTTEVQNRLGFWLVLSEGFVDTFPMHTVTRLGQNPEFKFYVRAEVR